MTTPSTAFLEHRTESFNSDTFWNSSSSVDSERDLGDVSADQVLPLGLPSRTQRRQSMASKPTPQVQPLNVSHIIGISQENTSAPLAFDKDSRVAFVSGCYVTLFDQRTNCQLQHLSIESRKRQISCLAISDDGCMLAAGEQGQDPAVALWRLEEDMVQGPVVLRCHRESITAICFSPDGRFLATVGNAQDAQLVLWDCERQSVLHSQLIHIQANFTSLTFSVDSKELYASGKSHFTMWSVNQKNARNSGNSSGVSLAPSTALPSSEKGVEIVDVKAGPSKKTPVVFAVTSSGILYKLRSQKGGMTIEKKTDLRVSRAYSLAVDSNKIAVSCANGTVKIVRPKTLAVETSITKPSIDAEGSSSQDVSSDAVYCAFDHSASYLAVVYADSTVAFWDSAETSRIRCYQTFKSPTGCITDIFSIPSELTGPQFLDRSAVKAMRSPNIHNPQAVESEFATCSDKGIINVWNLKIQTLHPRHQVLISQASDRFGRSSASRVEIDMQVIDTNPRVASKSRPAARRSKGGDILSGVGTGKEPKKKSVKSKAVVVSQASSTSKPKRATAKPHKKSVSASSSASTSKKTATKKATSTRPPVKAKSGVKTPAAMRLSTGITENALLRASIVAVPKAGPSKSTAVETESPRAEPARNDSIHLTCLRVSPDGMHLVAGDSKGCLRAYHLPSRKLLSKKELHSSPITTIEFSLPGKHGEVLLATGAHDGTVSVMEVHNNFAIKLQKEDHEKPVTGLSFSPEGTAVVSCGRDNYLYYESLNPPRLETEDDEDMELFLSRSLLMTSTFEAMHFNAARNTYMLACSDNFIRVYNTMGQFVHAIQVPVELGVPTKILQGSISSMIITCHENNSIGIFEYFTGRLIAVGKNHCKLTGALVISNGRHLVTTGEDGIMVIWELPEELRRRCMSAPIDSGVPLDEAGYANEFFFLIQREKERAAKAVSSSCSPGEESSSGGCGGVPMERMSLCDHSPYSGASTPVYSRPASRLSATGFSMDSPVPCSQPMTIPNGEHVRLPSWMSKATGLNDVGLMDGLESRSPSIYSRPPKLDLGNISDTDDEGLPAPLAMSRGNSMLNEQLGDFDSLPLDHFASGFSRSGLNCENDRFHKPVDSYNNRGRRSNDSCSGSSAFGLNPCTSLAQYMDDRPGGRSRGPFDTSDRGFRRPSGPEPPSSVSCTSDSRNSTPFSVHPKGGFDADANSINHFIDGDGNDEQFALLRSPYASHGPIGPNIRRIASRTPQSMYSDDKTVFSRPNSEEHANKMLAELRPSSDDSLVPALRSPFQPDTFADDDNTNPRSYRRNHSSFAFDKDNEVQFCFSDDEETVPFEDIVPVEHYEADNDIDFDIAASPMCCLSKNPLYSHRSVTSDVAQDSIRPLGGTPVEFLAEGLPIEKEASLSDMVDGEEPNVSEETPKCGSPVRKSTDLVWKVVKCTVAESLQKLRDDIGLHESLSDCALPTTRKQEFVDKAQHELVSLLERLQGQARLYQKS